MTHEEEGLQISLDREGENRYIKTRHPVKYGRYSEIETEEAIFRFNLNGEIVGAQGKGADWPSSLEWLKRSVGNDWIYYSTGGYSGSYEQVGGGVLPEPLSFKIPSPYNETYKATGEYYLANLPYESNSILGIEPFGEPAVQRIVDSWYDILERALADRSRLPAPYAAFAEKVLTATPQRLEQKAKRLFSISGGRVSVLPPGARHVDYNVIPLTVAHGCLYKCAFCTVKNHRPFATLPREEIDEQIEALAELYGEDLVNYNAIFLGEHDALAADSETLLYAVETAVARLGLRDSYMEGCSIFLFGSVDSFLSASEELFESLQELGCRFYINLGLESADQGTLEHIGKPITAQQVERSFARMIEINDRFEQIEVTANFMMGSDLPREHYPSFLRLTRENLDHPRSKGTVYLSPMLGDAPSRTTLFEFNQLKRLSRLPTFLYTIQRL